MKKIIFLITLVIIITIFIYQVCISHEKCFSFNIKMHQLLPFENHRDTKKSIGVRMIQPYHNRTTSKGLLNFKKQISCDPIYPEVLLYNRIFKTGSTSISNYIEDVINNTDISLKIGSTEDWYKQGDPWPYPDHIEKYANKTDRLVYTAHFFFRPKLKIKRPFTYINILRKPVDRVVSHFFYMRNDKIRPKHRIRQLKQSGQWNETLMDCVQNQHRGCEDNVMTRFLCGVPKFCNTGSTKALNRAKRNLVKYYAAVGILEEVEVFLKMLKQRLPSFFVRSHHQTLRNAKKNILKRDSRVSKDVLTMIRGRNHADVELYDFAKEVFEKRKDLCGL